MQKLINELTLLEGLLGYPPRSGNVGSTGVRDIADQVWCTSSTESD